MKLCWGFMMLLCRWLEYYKTVRPWHYFRIISFSMWSELSQRVGTRTRVQTSSPGHSVEWAIVLIPDDRERDVVGGTSQTDIDDGIGWNTTFDDCTAYHGLWLIDWFWLINCQVMPRTRPLASTDSEALKTVKPPTSTTMSSVMNVQVANLPAGEFVWCGLWTLVLLIWVFGFVFHAGYMSKSTF